MSSKAGGVRLCPKRLTSHIRKILTFTTLDLPAHLAYINGAGGLSEQSLINSDTDQSVSESQSIRHTVYIRLFEQGKENNL